MCSRVRSAAARKLVWVADVAIQIATPVHIPHHHIASVPRTEVGRPPPPQSLTLRPPRLLGPEMAHEATAGQDEVDQSNRHLVRCSMVADGEGRSTPSW